MNVPVRESISLLPFLVYLVGVLIVLAAMYSLSYLLGQRHHDKDTNIPYESGISPTGTARAPISVKFYLVAMLFVIFDLEVVFIFAWAIAARELGWSGYFGMLIFVAILVAGLIFEWRIGALDWLPRKRRIARGMEKTEVERIEQAVE